MLQSDCNKLLSRSYTLQQNHTLCLPPARTQILNSTAGSAEGLPEISPMPGLRNFRKRIVLPGFSSAADYEGQWCRARGMATGVSAISLSSARAPNSMVARAGVCQPTSGLYPVPRLLESGPAAHHHENSRCRTSEVPKYWQQHAGQRQALDGMSPWSPYFSASMNRDPGLLSILVTSGDFPWRYSHRYTSRNPASSSSLLKEISLYIQ